MTAEKRIERIENKLQKVEATYEGGQEKDEEIERLLTLLEEVKTGEGRLIHYKTMADNLGFSKEEILTMSDERFEKMLNLAELVASEEHWDDSPEEEGHFGGAYRDRQHYWENKIR